MLDQKKTCVKVKKKAEKEKPAQKAVKEFQFDEELASGTVCRTQIINIRK